MYTRTMQQIVEFSNVDAKQFLTEVAPLGQPAVLRGFISHWPAVAKATESTDAFCNYLKQFDQKIPAHVFIGKPEIKGRFWYNHDMRGFNFESKSETLTTILNLLVAHVNDPEPPAIYAGSVSIGQVMPQFARENSMPIVSDYFQPRIWIGNKSTIQTHYDVSDNLAGVVAGKRRFTLFPPDQVKNLYVGPLDFNPAGAPVSMVSIHDPDLSKYPNFKHALEAAYSADLVPGDVIFIPYMWWHHVESLSPFNALVTYWWDRAHANAGSAFTALVHAIMSVHSLPPERRAIWKQHFDHFVFENNGDPTSHLQGLEKGILHPMTPDLARYIKGWLLNELSK
jgi:hypothetical protein